jgi:hypothetical protein
VKTIIENRIELFITVLMNKIDDNKWRAIDKNKSQKKIWDFFFHAMGRSKNVSAASALVSEYWVS